MPEEPAGTAYEALSHPGGGDIVTSWTPILAAAQMIRGRDTRSAWCVETRTRRS